MSDEYFIVDRRNKNKILVVKTVDQNSPAEKSGIEVGDCITKVSI